MDHFWEDPLTGNCYACVVTEYVLKLQSMHSRSSVCVICVTHTFQSFPQFGKYLHHRYGSVDRLPYSSVITITANFSNITEYSLIMHVYYGTVSFGCYSLPIGSCTTSTTHQFALSTHPSEGSAPSSNLDIVHKSYCSRNMPEVISNLIVPCLSSP